jgi:hypothetical protein
MANEGAFGSLGGLGGGAALGLALGGPMGALLGAGIGGMAGGTIGGLFSKGPKRPDISGEMAKISAMFQELREQSIKNINREAAKGRAQSASNLAARGVYRSGVSQNTFNALEGERVNAIATSNAQLAGQEAQLRAHLLGQLLGMDQSAQANAAQISAGRAGALSGISSQLLMAALMSRGLGGGTPAPQGRVLNNPGMVTSTNAAYVPPPPVWIQ